MRRSSADANGARDGVPACLRHQYFFHTSAVSCQRDPWIWLLAQCSKLIIAHILTMVYYQKCAIAIGRLCESAVNAANHAPNEQCRHIARVGAVKPCFSHSSETVSTLPYSARADRSWAPIARERRAPARPRGAPNGSPAARASVVSHARRSIRRIDSTRCVWIEKSALSVPSVRQVVFARTDMSHPPHAFNEAT
eukprot:IDg19807t1